MHIQYFMLQKYTSYLFKSAVLTEPSGSPSTLCAGLYTLLVDELPDQADAQPVYCLLINLKSKDTKCLIDHISQITPITRFSTN